MNETKPSDRDYGLKYWLKTTKLTPQKALLLAAILLAGASLAVGYNVGNKQGLTKVGYDADAQDLAEIVDKQKQTLNSMSSVLNTTTQERDVAVDNAKQLSTDLSQAKQEQKLAQSLNTTYRRHLQLRGGVGLSVQNLAIKPLPNDAYEYILDLMQVSVDNSRTAGRAELRLFQGKEIVVIPMESAKFEFEHYQRLTGRWTMPKNFNPQLVEVRLTTKNNQLIAQRFVWQRGQQEVDSPALISEIPKTRAEAE